MSSARHLISVLALAVAAWLAPAPAHAELKLATLTVKGMVCQG
jgi:hypothetical protein